MIIRHFDSINNPDYVRLLDFKNYLDIDCRYVHGICTCIDATVKIDLFKNEYFVSGSVDSSAHLVYFDKQKPSVTLCRLTLPVRSVSINPLMKLVAVAGE